MGKRKNSVRCVAIGMAGMLASAQTLCAAEEVGSADGGNRPDFSNMQSGQGNGGRQGGFGQISGSGESGKQSGAGQRGGQSGTDGMNEMISAMM